jgi:hypothetical protein
MANRRPPSTRLEALSATDECGAAQWPSLPLHGLLFSHSCLSMEMSSSTTPQRVTDDFNLFEKVSTAKKSQQRLPGECRNCFHVRSWVARGRARRRGCWPRSCPRFRSSDRAARRGSWCTPSRHSRLRTEPRVREARRAWAADRACRAGRRRRTCGWQAVGSRSGSWPGERSERFRRAGNSIGGSLHAVLGCS